MKNKKASIFALGMVLAMIIFMSISWYSFTKTNTNIENEFDTIIIVNSYKNQKNMFSFYLNDAAKLASSQAFYEIAEEAAIDKNQQCNIYDNHLVWSQNCKPEFELVKKNFIEKYNKTLYNFTEKYPKPSFDIKPIESIELYHTLDLENSIIKTDLSEKIYFMEKQTNFAIYNLTYQFKPSTTLNLTSQEIVLEDFIDIYEEINNAVENCKNEENPVSCIKNENLVFERWIFNLEKKVSYLTFEFKTKKSFFFENIEKEEKFEPIILKFAIHI